MSPYWTEGEESDLRYLFEQGATIEDLAQHFSRSPEAIRLKLRRLGLAPPQQPEAASGSTTTPLPPIQPATELISLEEAMKTMLGALEQLRSSAALTKLEMQRYRMIVSLSKTYMHMLDRYQRWTELEQRLVDMEARTLERLRLLAQQSSDPAEKQKLERQIVELEQSLAQSSKLYKPFEKKPSLLAPPLGKRGDQA